MSDQQAAEPAAATEGTPAPADAQQEEENWQQRYLDTQAAYTQGQQEMSRLRGQVDQYADPEYRSQLFRELAAEQGYEIQDPADDDSQIYQETDPRIRAELEELKQWRDSTTSEQQQSQHIEWLDTIVGEQFGELGTQLTDKQEEWITNRAFSMPPREMPDGSKVPDIPGAFKDYQELVAEEKQSWAKSKRAPHVSAVGTAGTQVPNLDNRQERLDWMAERLMANEQQ